MGENEDSEIINERDQHQWKMFFETLQHTKKLTPEERMNLFIELQKSLYQTYKAGLMARYPDVPEHKLSHMAKKEAGIDDE